MDHLCWMNMLYYISIYGDLKHLWISTDWFGAKNTRHGLWWHSPAAPCFVSSHSVPNDISPKSPDVYRGWFRGASRGRPLPLAYLYRKYTLQVWSSGTNLCGGGAVLSIWGTGEEISACTRPMWCFSVPGWWSGPKLSSWCANTILAAEPGTFGRTSSNRWSYSDLSVWRWCSSESTRG